MKKTLLSLLVLATPFSALADAKIDPSLVKFARRSEPNETIKVIALMETPKLRFRSRSRNRAREVVKYLTESAKDSYAKVETFLSKHKEDGSVQVNQVFWINGSISATVDAEGLRTLADAPGVTKIYSNYKVTYTRGKKGRKVSRHGLDAIKDYHMVEHRIADLHKEMPHLDGRGVTVGHIDTGVDVKHPALKEKVVSFFDSGSGTMVDPEDRGEHGTHTAGTILGGDRGDDAIGIAPGARMIAAGFLENWEQELKSMEFMLTPKDRQGNPLPPPKVVSNSWNCESAPDREVFYRAISSWEAAGILPVFSAGNAGPRPKSITCPHEHPGVIAVGATSNGGKIADFSSRGPGIFKGEETKKPDLTAPGVDIVSSLPGTTYGSMSGTSMACPQVAGAAALLVQLKPNITPAEIRDVFMKTVIPTDAEGNPGVMGEWNPNYGYGRMNLWAAVHHLKDEVAFGPSSNNVLGYAYSAMQLDDLARARNILPDASEDATENLFAFPEKYEGDTWLNASEVW